MSALVLVHGGMHGPWCWDQVLPLLRDAGHEVHPLSEPVTLSATGFGLVPKTYLGARDDRALPWRFQQQMSAACGAPLTALGGDHSPFLSAVDELVDRLLLETTV